MIRLLPEEIEAVRLDQLQRLARERIVQVPAGFAVREVYDLEPRRIKTRYHVLVRPLASGRLRLVLAATRRIGEMRGVATWLVGNRRWTLDESFDFHGVGGWLVDWSLSGPRDEYWTNQRTPGPPVWPWATLANASAAMDTPWEWIAKAARRVDEKALTRYFAAAAKFPRAELIARAGLSDNWLRPSILSKLDRDPDFARFVAQNAAVIAEHNLRPLDVVGPFRRGRSIDWMCTEVDIRRAWDACPTYGVEFHEAERYLEAQKRRARERGERVGAAPNEVAWIEPTRLDYSTYCRDCTRLGLDLRSRSVAFPRSLSAAAVRVRGQLRRRHEEERRRRREIEAKTAAELAPRLASAAARVRTVLADVHVPAGWRIVVPASHEEFHREGETMCNCIGSGYYDRKMADGLGCCVFLAGPGDYRADMEIRFGRRPRLMQLYTRRNAPANAAATEVARRVVAALERNLSKPAA